MKRNMLLFICLAFLIIILAGCNEPAPPATLTPTPVPTLVPTPIPTPTPTIEYSFTPKLGNLYVTGGQTLNFVISSNLDDPGYTYAWSADKGTYSNDTEKTFSWTAPTTVSAQCTVTAIVSKDSTQIATKSWTVKVCDSVTFSGHIAKPIPAGGSLDFPGATVNIIGTGIDIYSTTSDSSGNFTFTNIPAGTFFVRVAESSIKTTYHFLDTTSTHVNLFVYSTAELATQYLNMGITADLNTKSLIHGVIFQSSVGPGMSGATVQITPASGTVGYFQTLYDPALTATSNSGMFCISDVVNGLYTITPAKEGKTFTPLELDINESALFIGLEFVAQ